MHRPLSAGGLSAGAEPPLGADDAEEGADDAADEADDIGLLDGVSELAGPLAAGAPWPHAESSSAPDAPTADRKTRENHGFFVFAISLASLCW
ncbi:hypothetical protein GCM10009565_63280 [Amycolatopsis albidoflavus]